MGHAWGSLFASSGGWPYAIRIGRGFQRRGAIYFVQLLTIPQKKIVSVVAVPKWLHCTFLTSRRFLIGGTLMLKSIKIWISKSQRRWLKEYDSISTS